MFPIKPGPIYEQTATDPWVIVRQMIMPVSVLALFQAATLARYVRASMLDNLIQAVNRLGSIFYGPTLGVFLVGFFIKHVRGTPVFIALVASQLLVFLVFAYSKIGFLWYNVIGCAALVCLALILDVLWKRPGPSMP